MTRDALRPEMPEAESIGLPFVAPCRSLAASAPLGWIRKGWADLRGAPGPSLAYGAAIVLLSWAVTGVGLRFGSYWGVLILLSGFVFIAPILALGLYSLSRQRSRGLRASVARSIDEQRKTLGTTMVFALALLVVFLIWARAASMVHVFFPMQSDPGWSELAPFLLVGSAAGTLFALLTFVVSAFSLPFICDRDADAVTAIVTSVNAVLRNKRAMLVWSLCIVGLTAIGFATALIGLGVTIPLLGHATWHGYQETIDSSAWPAHVTD